MSSIKVMFLAMFFSIISACSLLDPFVDRRRNAGETDLSKLYVGRSTKDAPAVCSNSLWTNPETIQALADNECEKFYPGTKAVKTKTSHFTCRLFIPTHTYFKCEKK